MHKSRQGVRFELRMKCIDCITVAQRFEIVPFCQYPHETLYLESTIEVVTIVGS